MSALVLETNAFARSDADFISDIKGLTGKKVGVVNGSQEHRQIVDGLPEIDLVPFGRLGQ
jgi:ABC-type amino acid transport substrate-binding protein